ncbi:Peptidyl-prolyl cis-trans isomerase NIMA-interacting protein 1 [Rhodotorula toruloides]
MNHDEELDFGEDELVPQVQQAADVLLDHHPTTHSSSRASDGARGGDRSANGSLNESGRNGGGSAAAGDQGVAGTSASKQLASTASETASAASTPPVSTSTTNKPHDETLDEKGNKLPEGWVSRVSKSTGRLYYRNTLLNTSEWDIPTRPAPASKGATPPPAAPAPQPAADELAPASSQVAPRPDLPAPVTREETQETRSAQQVEERKPRGHIHPDRLRLTSAEPVPAASPPTMPPTGPAADRNRAGAARYPPRRSSQSVNDSANAATTAAPPPTGPRATAPAGRQPLPPPVMPPTAPSRRRAKAAVTAANLVPVAPRGPRAAAAAAAPESPATPTPAAGTPTTEAPARTSSADDRWAAPKAAEPVAPNGPRFAVRGAAARGDKDLPPHLAHVPSGPRFAGSAPTPLVDDRWAKTSSSRYSRPASPPPRAEPSDTGRERQDSLGATSSTSGSGLTQAEKLEQQRLARLAVVGGAAVPSQPARHGRSPKRERVEPALAPSANDRYAALPIGPGRGKRPPPVAAKGANAMPVGGGGWGDRARLAKEKMEREAEEERKREAERKAKEEEEKKKSEERAKQRKEAERREREALRAEEDARREQERRAAAYGSRAPFATSPVSPSPQSASLPSSRS